MSDKTDKEAAQRLENGLKKLNTFASESIDHAFDSFEHKFSEAGMKKWRALVGRMAKAMMDNNTQMIQSLRADMAALVEEEKQQEKE